MHHRVFMHKLALSCFVQLIRQELHARRTNVLASMHIVSNIHLQLEIVAFAAYFHQLRIQVLVFAHQTIICVYGEHIQMVTVRQMDRL